ncbi:MAG: STM4012 family radical SAM protein [Sandaracinaceae bacterium]
MTQHPLEGSPYQGYTYSYPHKTAHRPLDPARPLREVWADEDRSALFLYLHVPFCEMRCGFCNLFTTTGAGDDEIDRYLGQLARQAEVTHEALAGAAFARMAIGGGTPTLLSPRQLERLFAIAARLGAASAPTSVETSPRTATPERLAVLREAGVRRVSMGVQSFDPRVTKTLGRSQREVELDRALRALRDADFDVLNLDLMYGAQGQSTEGWLDSIRAALEWDPEELFLYPLYVRPLTALGTREAWTHDAAHDEARLDAYRAGRALLLERGYAQISMRLFRRADADGEAGARYRCQEDGMVGLGAGARSYTERLHYAWPYAVSREGVREGIAHYLSRTAAQLAEAHHGVALSRADRVRRHVLMSILHRDGLALDRFVARFGRDPRLELPLSELERRGWLVEAQGRLVPTAAGLERSDAIGPWLYSAEIKARMEAFAWR